MESQTNIDSVWKDIVHPTIITQWYNDLNERICSTLYCYVFI